MQQLHLFAGGAFFSNIVRFGVAEGAAEGEAVGVAEAEIRSSRRRAVGAPKSGVAQWRRRCRVWPVFSAQRSVRVRLFLP